MHLDQERVERLLHGELSPGLMTSAREHVALCDECGVRLRAARDSEARIQVLLAQLDHPMRRPELEAVIGRARTRDVTWLRLAAAIVFAVALGGVAYATPGSPVRAFLQSLLHRSAAQAPTEPAPVPLPDGAVEPAAAGIAVRPGKLLVIEFKSPGDGARARVVLGEGDEVVVRAPAGAATFSSEADRLVIGVREPATFDIEIPRAAPRVELRAGSRRIFLKDGARISTSSAADSGTSWVLPLDRIP